MYAGAHTDMLTRPHFTLFMLKCLSQVAVNLQQERPDSDAVQWECFWSDEGLTPAQQDPGEATQKCC